MDFEVLLRQNPWWKGKSNIDEDSDYEKWKKSKIRWTPSLAEDIELKPFSLHFVFGPRQVGKTTALKLLIRKELEKRSPKEIFYFRCDEIKDYKELNEVLKAYLDFRKDEGINTSLIILDEITFPDEWWRAVKGRIDGGDFKKDVVILTGSASIEVRKHTEYFPGRRGNGKNFQMHPLSFRDFACVADPDLGKKLDSEPAKNKVYLRELNKMLKDYFLCGGFPLAVTSFIEKGHVSGDVKDTYLAWIKNDLAKADKDERIGREILKVVMNKIPSPVSFESIAKETSIKSPKTIASYLHTLSDLFVLRLSYFIDLNSMVAQFGKNKKIQIIDPLLFSVFEEWGLIQVGEKESKVAEAVLAEHLFRKYGNAFYWSGKEEVDTVVMSSGRLIGFECKWKEKAKEKKIYSGKMNEVWTLSKSEFGDKMMPISVFLSGE